MSTLKNLRNQPEGPFPFIAKYEERRGETRCFRADPTLTSCSNDSMSWSGPYEPHSRLCGL
eukprot:scaffold83462_cov30-Tisochrysis_lutea.AAC.1